MSIDRLAWRLSPATERGLHKRVRQAALRDAIAKAENYASVLQRDYRLPGERVRVVEIADNSAGAPGGARAMFAAAGGMARSGAQKPTITIEPEPITVAANIFVKFDVMS